jgi:stage II sporulation protein D
MRCTSSGSVLSQVYQSRRARLAGICLGCAWLANPGAAAEPLVTLRLFRYQEVKEVSLIRGRQTTLLSAVHTPAAGNEFRGRWKLEAPGFEPVSGEWPLLVATSGKSLLFTVRLPREDYVAAVLAGEAAILPPEALKAMAVAARTYAFRFAGRHRAEGFDFCDTTHCQDARLAVNPARAREAAEATEAELLWWKGTPAAAFYARDCGGHTESGQTLLGSPAPYLPARPDPFCPRAAWSATIEKTRLQGALAAEGLGRVTGVFTLSKRQSGRVHAVRAGGRTIPAESFRLAVGRQLGWNLVRSDWYELDDRGAAVHFTGRGSGHGVGLCQLGAAAMAQQGADYRKILEQYYPGVAIGVSARGIPWTRLGGERVELLTTSAAADRPLVALADRLAAELEARVALAFPPRTRIVVYPSVAVFRDATGEPGWVAASTRHGAVRLAPAGRQAPVIRHELAHVLLEAHAHPSLPRWFREGMVLYLGDAPAPRSAPGQPPDEDWHGDAATVRRAYQQAHAQVLRLMNLYGDRQVFNWIPRGLPLVVLPPAPPPAASPRPR